MSDDWWSDPDFRCEACDEPIVDDDTGLCARCINQGVRLDDELT
jgi:hypothetical protein